MRRLRGEVGLWTATVAFSLAASAAARVPETIERPPSDFETAPNLSVDRKLIADSVLSAASFVATHDPFRITHEPASVPYGTTPPPLAPPMPRPVPILRGIVGAPGRWSAILAGVPGHDGNVVLQTGDSAGGLRVRQVTMTTAVIVARDTIWTLKLDSPWP